MHDVRRGAKRLSRPRIARMPTRPRDRRPLPARARTAEAMPPVRVVPTAVALPPVRMPAPVTEAMPLTRKQRPGVPARWPLPQPCKKRTNKEYKMPCAQQQADLGNHCIRLISNVAVLVYVLCRRMFKGLNLNKNLARSLLFLYSELLASVLSHKMSITTELSVQTSTSVDLPMLPITQFLMAVVNVVLNIVATHHPRR